MARSYWVFNETDGIYAYHDPFKTVAEAVIACGSFVDRFKTQGFYRNSRGERLPLDEVRLLVQDGRGKVYHQHGKPPTWYFIGSDGSHGEFRA